MFFLSADPAKAVQLAVCDPHSVFATEGATHHTPALVEALNHFVGPPVCRFQVTYTKPIWEKIFGFFGTTPEQVFAANPYSWQNAVPWYTVMFVLACVITMLVIWILMPRRLSAEDPTHGQQTLEAGVLAVRNLLMDNVGVKGVKYFPVVATFGVLILVSNLMGLVPGLMSPTASTSVTFALGISSFVYYNWIGIKENGLFGHLKHFAGPILWLAPLMFPIELISNFVRPLSLGVRLFGNLFGDEQVLGTVGTLAAGASGAAGLPSAPWLLPVIIMPLSLFVAFMQTFIFVLLSIIYISEVTHHDDEHAGHGEASHADLHEGGGVITAPAHV